MNVQQTRMIKDRDETVLRNGESVLRRWKETLRQKLMNDKNEKVDGRKLLNQEEQMCASMEDEE